MARLVEISNCTQPLHILINKFADYGALLCIGNDKAHIMSSFLELLLSCEVYYISSRKYIILLSFGRAHAAAH